MRRVVLTAVLTVGLLRGALSHADEPAPPAKKSLRRPVEPPVEVEVVDLTGDRDPQFFALGAHIGGGYLWNNKSIGQGAGHAALTFAFGLGPNGARVPWTLEPYAAFAITYGAVLEKGGHPNRFTEIGARIVYRGEQGLLAHRWLSLGGGLVWTSQRPSSGFLSPGRECFNDPDKATAAGLDCSEKQGISPALLVDLGVGLQEWTTRRARFGFALRTPLQISSAPGFAAFLTVYGQVGTL